LGAIWYEKSAYNPAEHLYFHENQQRDSRTFFIGVTEITPMCVSQKVQTF
jgi:hypothetical protein